jgi:hypothetical protein
MQRSGLSSRPALPSVRGRRGRDGWRARAQAFFDLAVAREQGVLVPCAGADSAYDAATADIARIEGTLADLLEAPMRARRGIASAPRCLPVLTLLPAPWRWPS